MTLAEISDLPLQEFSMEGGPRLFVVTLPPDASPAIAAIVSQAIEQTGLIANGHQVLIVNDPVEMRELSDSDLMTLGLMRVIRRGRPGGWTH